MKVILTGITGNLGYEVARDLEQRSIEIIPISRSIQNLRTLFKKEFTNIIENNLEDRSRISYNGGADLIIHCAGNVHLEKTNDKNKKMVEKIISLAKQLQIPLYFVSTAFVYRPKGIRFTPHNAYELDKYNAEKTLIKSGVRYAIFRPSVLVGNSKTGEIQNFSGYYSIVNALVKNAYSAKRKKKRLRIPKFTGFSDIIPVDYASSIIGEIIEEKKLGEFYITNPNPPKATWLLAETLDFFKINDFIEILNCSFEDFGKLKLTLEENNFYNFSKHFTPYWSTDFLFPNSLCRKNPITHSYLLKILTFFRKSTDLFYG